MPPIKPVADKISHSTPGASSAPATHSSGSHQHPTLSSPPVQKQLGTNNTRKVTENLYRKPGKSILKASAPATGSAPISSGFNTTQQAWLDTYNDRLQRMQQAQDPALKAHYQAEADVIKQTLDQMGIAPTTSAPTTASVPTTSVPTTSVPTTSVPTAS